jgi:hypothetical protein
MRTPDAKWVYVIPGIHLGVCLTIWAKELASGVHYLIYVDFPVSLIVVILGWRNDDFLVWFATLGTMWWFGLSYIGLRALNSALGSRK